MFRTIRSFPHPGPSGLSLPTLLGRAPTLLLLAGLLMASLVACGGDSGGPFDASTVRAPAKDTPTPEARNQEGVELTTQEYADALEEAFSGLYEQLEETFEDLMFDAHFSDDKLERMSSLESAESWSKEDEELASSFAETLLRAVIGAVDDFPMILKSAFDETSSLRPPEHLSDLHGNFIATFGESGRIAQKHWEDVKEAFKKTDTDIRSPEDLAEFQAVINSLESGPLDPELEKQAEHVQEKFDEACVELREHLEAELERDVYICE